MAIVYRIGNGSALTYTEVDGNFRYLLSNMSGSIVAITGSTQISGSLSVLPEGTVNQLTSSWAISASVATSASYAANASVSNVVRTNLGDTSTQIVEGNVRLTGDIIAEQYIISSSVVHYTESFASGSHIFGDDSLDTHQFTGSILVSGSITGFPTVTNDLTASYAITASHALNAGGSGGIFAETGSYQATTNNIQITGTLEQGGGAAVDAHTNTDPSKKNVLFGKANEAGSNWLGFVHGQGNKLSGNYAHAEGYLTTASGQYSHTEGHLTQAIGQYSHAEGENTRATNTSDHAEGKETLSDGPYAHAEGYQTTASGQYSHAEGQETKALGWGSHAEGRLTRTSNNFSHAEGVYTSASAHASHAEGSGSKATGIGSHAEGRFSTASGDYSHAEGSGRATGNYSHAEGGGLAAGNYSHAEGFLVTASGNYSHAEGFETEAGRSGVNSYAHAEGNRTVARGTYSHAAGNYTIASGSGQNVVGDYNLHGNTTSLFVIGDGASDGARSDLLRAETGNLQVTGSTKMTGSLAIDGTLSSVVNNPNTYGFRLYNTGSAGDGIARHGLFLKAGNPAIATDQYPINVKNEQEEVLFYVKTDDATPKGFFYQAGGFNIGVGDGSSTNYTCKIGNLQTITEFTGPTTAKSYTLLDGDASAIGVRISDIRSPIADLNSKRLRICTGAHSIFNVGDIGVSSSTRKQKKNIVSHSLSIEEKTNILNSQLVNFQWKGSEIFDFGYIAEDIANLVPELAEYSQDFLFDEEGNNIKISGSYATGSNAMVPSGINYDKLSIYLLEIIKDQQKEINDLASRIAALE